MARPSPAHPLSSDGIRATTVVTLHPPAIQEPALSAERCGIDRQGMALLDALPAPLRATVSAGVTRQACFDGAGGFTGLRETWSPPAAVDPATASAAAQALASIENGILAPVDPGWLLARLLSLFAHCPPRSVPLDPAVERMVAGDWADDLGEYPQWAVDHAVRIWRRTRKWRPTIAEMRTLCDEAVATERAVVARLRRIAAVPVEAGETTGADRREEPDVRALAGRAIRRL